MINDEMSFVILFADGADGICELFDACGFGEVDGETCFAASADVVFLAVAGEGDGGEVEVALAYFSHEVEAAAVGEAKVADEQVEDGDGEGVERGGQVVGGDDVVVVGYEKTMHHAKRVVVVLDEEDAERSCKWKRCWGFGGGGEIE